MINFLKDWSKFYGDTPPLSFALPRGENWVRFHALPESKRYAETPAEESEVLRRANVIADEILGFDECWIAQLGSVDMGWDSNAERWRDRFDLEPAGEIFYDELAWPVFAGRTRFQPGAFDGLFRDIAADQAFRTLWFNSSNGRVFAPYDGGFDTYLETPDVATGMKTKHQAWLSPRSDGM